MKKLIKVLLCLSVFVLLIGCTSSNTTTTTDKENNSENSDSDIGIIETYGVYPSYSYEVFYDKDTKVCYIAIADGVTPLYNADGSLKIYNEDKE